MKAKFLPIVIAVLIVSCQPSSREENSDSSFEEIAWKKAEEVNQLDIQDMFSKSRYIVLNLPEDLPFYTADKIQSGDGKFFLADIKLENTILILDQSGNFVHQLLTGGNGPGEIPKIEDFVYHPNRNSLLILTGWKLLEFSTQGEFIQEITFPKGEVYNFLTYGGGNSIWLYTLPPPADRLPSSDFRQLIRFDLEKKSKLDAFFEVPKGLQAQVSGVKELSYQNGQAVFAPAFGNKVYYLRNEKEEISVKTSLFRFFAPTDNFYGLPDLGQFLERLQDEMSTAFVDNHLDLGEFILVFVIKNGIYSKWGSFEKESQRFILTDMLVDGKLGLPLLPHLDIQDRAVYKLLDSEFFDQMLMEDTSGVFIQKVKSHAPSLMNQEIKMLLCIYEN